MPGKKKGRFFHPFFSCIRPSWKPISTSSSAWASMTAFDGRKNQSRTGGLIRDGKSGGSEVLWFSLAFPYQFHKFFLCVKDL